MMKSFQGLRGLFCVCFALAALSVLAMNGYALAVAVVFGIWAFLRHGPLPSFTPFLLVGGFLLRVIIIIPVRPPLDSDFLVMFQAAQSLLQGDLSFHSTAYFSLWAYQSVFVAWEAMWLAIWNDARCLMLVNAALASATVCFLYRMAREWVSEQIAQAASLLLTLFPFALTLHTLLSNQIPSAFFLTLSLWLLVSQDCRVLKFWRFPLAGLAMQVGNLLRSEGIIFLCAALAWGVLEVLRRPEGAKRLALGFLTLLVVYFSVYFTVGYLVRASGLNPAGISNGNPGWKLVTGLNYDTSGGYSQSDWERISATLDDTYHTTPETHALQRQLIAQRLSTGPIGLLRLAIRKIQLLWCSDALYWTLGASTQFSGRSIYELVRQFDRGLFFLTLGLAALGLFPQRRWRERATEAYLPYLVFFAAFCALLLLEVQPRYAYLPQLSLFTAAAFGLERLEILWAANTFALPGAEKKREFHEQAEQAD